MNWRDETNLTRLYVIYLSAMPSKHARICHLRRMNQHQWYGMGPSKPRCRVLCKQRSKTIELLPAARCCSAALGQLRDANASVKWRNLLDDQSRLCNPILKGSTVSRRMIIDSHSFGWFDRPRKVCLRGDADQFAAGFVNHEHETWRLITASRELVFP